jgi:hypothetical protein
MKFRISKYYFCSFDFRLLCLLLLELNYFKVFEETRASRQNYKTGLYVCRCLTDVTQSTNFWKCLTWLYKANTVTTLHNYPFPSTVASLLQQHHVLGLFIVVSGYWTCEHFNKSFPLKTVRLKARLVRSLMVSSSQFSKILGTCIKINISFTKQQSKNTWLIFPCCPLVLSHCRFLFVSK